jgi:radical SAM superfamily enzyme YgiQ (UPF0313 family)
MSRVLLINPPKEVPLLDWTMRYAPLGLMSLAAVLDGHDVEILDMKVERLNRKQLLRRLSSFDIVGVSVLTPSIDSALEICRAAKSCGALTVAGGVHPTLMPEVVGNPDIDIVVRGEGEYSLKAIADGLPLTAIPGISYMNGARLVHNPDPPPADLGALPPPRRDLVASCSDRYQAFGKSLGALSTARGCPFRCSFCCVPRIWKGDRELTPAAVVAELDRMDYTEVVSFVDDNFCQDMMRVDAICDLIIQHGLNDRLYSVFSRVDSIVQHPQVVAKMARANMRVVFIGIEAATQAALDRMNKKTRIADIHRACEILETNGMLIWAGHIIGNLDDTYEDVDALIAMSRKLPVDIADFTVITPYPGTELYERAREQGLIDEFDFAEYCECEPHMHTPNLSRVEIMELQIKAYLKFYGLRALAKGGIRWSRNREKRWILQDNIAGIRSFMRFRRKSAFYFWRTYKETVGKTEGTRIRRHSPLVSTPKVYSLGAGVAAALITLWLTVLVGRYYGQYSSRPLAFIVADILFGAALVGFTVGLVGAWLAIRSYRRGWIFSVRKRRPEERSRSIGEVSLSSGVLFTAAAVALAALTIVAVVLAASSARLGYGLKEILVTAIAFLTAMFVSHHSIQLVRNGGIARN